MRLRDLIEATSSKIWYHGTPEMQKLKDNFEQRHHRERYVADPTAYAKIRAQLEVTKPGDSGYAALATQIDSIVSYKQVRSPVFLTDNRAVAKTYADGRRAFDYQAAEPGIIKVSVDSGKTLTINGKGQSFRGITIEAVRDGLLTAGVSIQEIEAEIAHYPYSIRQDGKLSTNALAAIVDSFGYDIVDVERIKDNYTGTGPNATVRMVMNPSLIHRVAN
jgi:hypothetical protein